MRNINIAFLNIFSTKIDINRNYKLTFFLSFIEFDLMI